MQQAACNGIWSKGAPCSSVDCKSPAGACCEVPSGKCSDGVTRSQCPNRHSWLLNGRCGKDGWCIGGCCNEAASNCTETTAGRCRPPGKWSLYSKCDKDYCPVEVSLQKSAGFGVLWLLCFTSTKIYRYCLWHVVRSSDS